MIPVRSTLEVKSRPTRLYSFEEEAEEASRRIFEGLGVTPGFLDGSTDFATARLQVTAALESLANQPLRPSVVYMNQRDFEDIMRWSQEDTEEVEPGPPNRAQRRRRRG